MSKASHDILILLDIIVSLEENGIYLKYYTKLE